MSTVYFAKFNINEKIYDVYKNESNINALLNSVMNNMNTKDEISEPKGNKKKNLQEEDFINFKFISLEKDPDKKRVTGSLITYAFGTHISYDETLDDVIESPDPNKATYITFCFDLRNEVIGFVPKNDFGRNQFMRRFKKLIEKSSPEIGDVELFLYNDKNELEVKLAPFKEVREVKVNMIPPNNDKELFEELFGPGADELKDTRGTNFWFTIRGKLLDLHSLYIKKFIEGTKIGYATFRAEGKDNSNEYYSVKSEEDALYTKNVNNRDKNSIPEIQNKTEEGVREIQISNRETRENLQELSVERRRQLMEYYLHNGSGDNNEDNESDE